MSRGAIQGGNYMFGSGANTGHMGVGGICNKQQSGFKGIQEEEKKSITLDPEPSPNHVLSPGAN